MKTFCSLYETKGVSKSRADPNVCILISNLLSKACSSTNHGAKNYLTIYFKKTEKLAFKSNHGKSEMHFLKKKNVQLMLTRSKD